MVEQGFQVFSDLLGQAPRIHVNHLNNRDNVYWGPDRFTTPLPRLGYRLGARGRRFEGGADQGARKPAGQPITEAQLKKMTPAQIAMAHEEGKLSHLM
jgi:hypothetical protein